MANNITIDLKKVLDKDKRPYYIGKLQGPVLLDATDGICLLIFTSIEGEETLQIASLNKKEKFNNNQE